MLQLSRLFKARCCEYMCCIVATCRHHKNSVLFSFCLKIVTAETIATVTTLASRTVTILQVAAVDILLHHHHHPRRIIAIITNRDGMELRPHRTGAVVGMKAMGIALVVVQPVITDEGTVMINTMNEMLGGVKRVTLQQDISVAAVAVVVAMGIIITVATGMETKDGTSKSLHASKHFILSICTPRNSVQLRYDKQNG